MAQKTDISPRRKSEKRVSLFQEVLRNVPTECHKDECRHRESEKRSSQYEELMRKFSESHKEECKAVSMDIPKAARWKKQFPTGSQYEGTWDVLGMSGTGTYTFPSGLIYEGEFYDGEFHGTGELRYPNGKVIKAKFRNGNLVDRKLIFSDGLEYSEGDWKYCQMPDRRYTIEYEIGVQPAGESIMTPQQPTRVIPPGYYDTGDGFYDSDTKVVYRYDDLTAIVRSPSEREHKWILENCRMCPSDQVGPRADLYEEWLEADPDPLPPPLPAAASKSTAYRFESSETLLEDDDSDTVGFQDWQRILEGSHHPS